MKTVSAWLTNEEISENAGVSSKGGVIFNRFLTNTGLRDKIPTKKLPDKKTHRDVKKYPYTIEEVFQQWLEDNTYHETHEDDKKTSNYAGLFNLFNKKDNEKK